MLDMPVDASREPVNVLVGEKKKGSTRHVYSSLPIYVMLTSSIVPAVQIENELKNSEREK